MGKTASKSPATKRSSKANLTAKAKSQTKTVAPNERTIRIEVQESDPTKNPVVVSFPNGMPQALLPDEKGPGVIPPTFVWQRFSQKSAFGRRLIGNDQHCLYTAATRGLGYDERKTKLCVGIYDKKRGILRLHEAANKGTVFALRQSVPSYAEKGKVMEADDGAKNSRSVFQDFGSAKKRKVLKSQTANQVDIEHVVGAGAKSALVDSVVKGGLGMSESNRKAIGESMDTSASDVGSPQVKIGAVESAYAASRDKILPKYNDKAEQPGQVYSAQDIAGEAAWGRILQDLDACWNADNGQDVLRSIAASVEEKNWANCVKDILPEIPVGSKTAKDRFAVTYLLNWVVMFYKKNSGRKMISKPNPTNSHSFGIPTEVAVRCTQLFTSPIPTQGIRPGYVMTKVDKDKLFVHALLLYMMAQGLGMKVRNISAIAAELNIDISDAILRLRLAGCTVGKTGGNVGAMLKVPLTFPPPQKRIKRSR
jgi:hypothetical protein